MRRMEDISRELRDYSYELFTQDSLMSMAERGKIDAYSWLEEIAKETNIKKIISRLDAFKKDLLCLVKNQIMQEDEKYKKLSEELGKSFTVINLN